jgi:oxygen-independent coproporphyrinogen-3 oxidase
MTRRVRSGCVKKSGSATFNEESAAVCFICSVKLPGWSSLGDEIEEMMELTVEWADRHGYNPYYMYRQKNILGNLENIGYSLEGKESLYNIVMMEERQTIIGLGCGAVSKIMYPKQLREDGSEQQKIERFPNPKEPSVYNQSYRDYIDKKIKLLNEAYGLSDIAAAQLSRS